MRLTYATRRSQLALAQSRAFVAAFRAASGVETEELQIVTSGDKNQTDRLQELGGKGLFIKELEEALYDKRADFAVHSMKDVPAELAKGLAMACIPDREDPRDVLVTNSGALLKDLPAGAVIGSSSLRRAVCLQRARPDIEVKPVRGNVDTRLRKMEEGQFDGIVLALAGLKRLGIESRATQILEPSICLPAIGQGALGIEIREDDDATRTALDHVSHAETSIAVAAERALMRAVEGDCKTPVAAYARRDGDRMQLDALLADPDGTRVRTGSRTLAWPSLDDAERVGRELGLSLLSG